MTNEMTNTRFVIFWTDRHAYASNRTFDNLADAKKRLAYLDEAEARTRQCMLTCSDDVRFSYQQEAEGNQQEAEAIRDLLDRQPM